MQKVLRVMVVAILILIMSVTPALAEEGPAINWTEGPATVDLGEDLATLSVPEDMVFTGAEGSKELMKYLENPVTDQEIGVVVPKDENQSWFILFEYDPIGYVKDDESNDLDADKLLKDFTEGTEEWNKELEKKGIPPMEIIGWDEQPHYDEATHNLVWSIILESDGEKSINYNTRLLGRYGVVSVTLVADPEDLATLKPVLNKVIGGFGYKEGQRYSDFVPGKDKVSELGLAALVAGGAGVAAGKAGLIAKLLLLFKKGWILLAVGIGAIYRKLKARSEKKKQTGSGQGLEQSSGEGSEHAFELDFERKDRENQDKTLDEYLYQTSSRLPDQGGERLDEKADKQG